jgi:hypothetical protein
MAYPESYEPLDEAMNPTRTLAQEAHAARHNDVARIVNALQQKHLGSLVLNVKDYGAVGDGLTDCLTAFTDALADLPDGGVLVVPPGTYLLSAAITGDHNGIHLLGSGGDLTSRIKAGGNYPVLDGAWEYCLIENLTLDAGGFGAEAVRLFVGHTMIRHCTITGWTGKGLNLNDGTHDSQWGGDLGYLNHVERCQIEAGTGYGIYTTYRFTDSWITYNNVGSSSANIRVESGPMRIIGNHLNGSPEYNIEFQSPRRITVEGNILEGALKSAIYHQMPSWETGHQWHELQIVGNAFSNGGYDDPGVYPAIHLYGKSATDRTQGQLITGNLFAVDDGGAGWSNIVDAKWADELTIVGNMWGRGYDATDPVRLEACGSNTQVLGNGGRNAVTAV